MKLLHFDLHFYLFGLVCTMVLPLTVFAQPAAADGTWLDKQPFVNWNRAEIPKAAIVGEPVTTGRCKEMVRQPTTPEDKAVAAAGWTLYNPYQLFSGTSVVSAMSGVDGMCRPLGYQDFVFVDGKFAGTLSPTPMDSRTDGALDRLFFVNASRLSAEFRRYSQADALCCPSRTSTVSYKIERQKNLPVVVPVNVTTNPNSP